MMNAKTFFNWLAVFGMLCSFNLTAEDIDIFNNPQGPAGKANVLIMFDNRAAINAKMTDIDGTDGKIYDVSAHVLRALLDPDSLRIKFISALFPASAISSPSDTCQKTPTVITTGCTCANFGYETDGAYCKLTLARANDIKAKLLGVRMGVMAMNGNASTGISNANAKGGYVAFHMQDLGDTTATPPVRTAAYGELQAKLASLATGNTSTYALGMEEAYRYFSQIAPNNGWAGSKAYDQTTPNGSTAGYDRRSCGKANPSATCTGNYTLSSVANSCRNAIVVIGPGEPANSSFEKDGTYLKSLYPQSAAVPYPIDIPGSTTDEDNMFDEWARYLAVKDFGTGVEGVQGINTYTIITEEPGKTNNAARKFMASAANVSGGLAFVSQSGTEFLDALISVLDKVQSVNSEFASVALPVSVNVRGTNLNQVYVGMFRPDKDGKPRWFGNMKEYKLALDGSDVILADADGLKAETTDGSLIAAGARSFWTTSSNYWGFSYATAPSDNPDGRTVEKGAAAQVARLAYATETDLASRKVFTCINCANNSDAALTDTTSAFKDDNPLLTDATSGKLKDTTLINWCRGLDNFEDENKNGSTTDVRASLYGDVLHSNPAIINYNTTTTCSDPGKRNDNDVYVFYGSNDGFLKATKGGNDSGGQEQWAFVAEEHLSTLEQLRTNSALTKKPYFVDGSITSHVEYAKIAPESCNDASVIQKVTTNADGSKAWIFATMRRGGRFVYALDVKNPAAPVFKWKIDQNTPGFGKLGYTFSELKTAKILLNGTATPVVIFGGGYDPSVEDITEASTASWDASKVTLTTGTPATTVSRSMGNAVYVVNADTGDLIWRASSVPATTDCPTAQGAICVEVSEMTYAIPSDISVVDRNYDGYADRLYFGDTGANIWRANIASDTPGGVAAVGVTPAKPAWNTYKLATFQTKVGSESDASRHRKFLYKPDVVPATGYDMVLIGSGDREQPFDRTVVNRYYVIKDDPNRLTAPATILTESSSGMHALTATDLNPVSGSFSLDDATSKGWFYTLTESGEKVVSSPVTLNRISFFNTNIPRNDCSSGLGEARVYALEAITGQAPVYSSTDGLSYSAYKTVPGGGFLPTGVPAVVEVGGKLREVLLIGTKVSEDIGTIQLGRRVRTYWYQGIDQ